MKVQIINFYNDKCWYKNEIGKIFEVSNKLIDLNDHQSYCVIQNNSVSKMAININDCKIIKE